MALLTGGPLKEAALFHSANLRLILYYFVNSEKIAALMALLTWDASKVTNNLSHRVGASH